MDEIDEDEVKIIEKYNREEDENILLDIINHPWHYSGGMVMWTIEELTRIKLGIDK
jgi:hypothetical protein